MKPCPYFSEKHAEISKELEALGFSTETVLILPWCNYWEEEALCRGEDYSCVGMISSRKGKQK